MELMEDGLDIDLEFSGVVFSGSTGMMCREWRGDARRSEDLERNRLRRTGGVFETCVTEGDGLCAALLERQSMFDVVEPNANKQSRQFEELTLEFLNKCP